MPKYLYRCLDCRRRFQVFLTYAEYDSSSISCRHCGSESVQRQIGRVRFTRSEESRLEAMADPAQLEGLEDDPEALGRMMRTMSSELGEDLGPEFEDVVDRLEAGQSPEEIEEAMPDLGADDLD